MRDRIDLARLRTIRTGAVMDGTDETEFEHTLKNHMAIILGYADLLLVELGADDPRAEDVREIHRAATAATALVTARRRSAT